MKILFNCSTNIVGGGIKNSAIFIKYALTHNEIDWVFAVSKPVMEILKKWKISSNEIHLFNTSPAKNRQSRLRLYNLSEENDVDIVYTMAGPAYINFKRKHILGISNPYLTHADVQSFLFGRNVFQLINTFLVVAYQIYHARKADIWLFQTYESRNKFIKRNLIKEEKTKVIPNAIGNEFIDYYINKDFKACNFKETINIFCPAAGYPHKCLQMIPRIAKELHLIANDEYNFKFILTIKDDSELWNRIKSESENLSVNIHLINIGPYNYADALKIFDRANIIFVPSILETFTASYLEAFASKKPLIVANKGFSKDICKDAALYVDPLNANQSASSIHDLIIDKTLQTKLIDNGSKIVTEYDTQEDRTNHIIDFLKSNASISGIKLTNDL